MRKCPACGQGATILLGENYCTHCGSKTVEVPERYICGNSACGMHAKEREFTSACKFCGECGFPIVKQGA